MLTEVINVERKIYRKLQSSLFKKQKTDELIAFIFSSWIVYSENELHIWLPC